MYKKLIYTIASKFSPDFNKTIISNLKNKHEIVIADVGFYEGTFSKNLIEQILKKQLTSSFKIFSFDPNTNISLVNFKNFVSQNNIVWRHSNSGLGDKNKNSSFTVLANFPASGSSINNILINSLWYKTRKLIFSPFSFHKTKEKVLDIKEEMLDSVFDNDSLDVLKIDVEGYTKNVLIGSEKTIKNFSPIIQLEILAKKNKFKKERQDIIKFLNQYNYSLVLEKKHLSTHILSDVMCSDFLFIKN